MINKPPMLPWQELFENARRATNNSVWAIEKEKYDDGKFTWVLYCSDKRQVKKLPQVYRGIEVKVFNCQKPRICKTGK